MRDIALVIIVGVLIPYILMKPQVGIYAWSWLSYMNPHRLTWGFAYNLPFAQSVALATILGIIFWKQPKRVPINGLTVLWMIFLGWMLVTTLFAMYPDAAQIQYIKILKIQLITFLTMMVIQTRKDLHILIWVIALSVGFFGIKGGVFTIQTLGSHRVWGPPGTFIEDNNGLAIALLMVLPLFYFLWQQTKRKWLKYILLAFILLIAVSVIGSQSRGALLAICASGFFLWLKSPGKIITGVLMFILALSLYSFMPKSWHERMDLIANYEQDESAMGRIAAWKMSVNVASSRLTGGGLDLWHPATYRIYSPNPNDWDRNTAAHSIYFSVLAEHGWIGLLMFVSIFFLAWRQASKIIHKVRGSPDLRWASDLMRMVQVSIIAYAAGGAFLQLSYFDLPWHLVSIVVIVRQIVANNRDQENEKADNKALSGVS